MLIHDPSWPNFVKHYWLSFVWITAAVVTVIVFVIGGEQALSSPMVFVPVGAGIFRALRGGWRPDKDVQQNEGCLVVIMQLVFAVALWPVFEVFRQTRFLWRARQIWPNGEILVNDKDRPLRSA